jgi:signal transduction histidine kinase
MILGLWRLRVWHIRREFELVLAERVRLSRAIHDTLLQGLVGVSLQIDTLSTLLDTSSAARDHLTRLRRHVEEYIREARQSIWNLRSPMLDRRTLADALKSAGENAVKDASVSFEMAVSGTLRECPPPVEEHLLRIGQEAIMNALRHAHPSRLRASLQYDADAIRLQILDDGCGFFITENSVSDHYGLKSMRERAEQIGGHLQIVTKPQEGTRVEVTVPLASDPILQDELA